MKAIKLNPIWPENKQTTTKILLYKKYGTACLYFQVSSLSERIPVSRYPLKIASLGLSYIPLLFVHLLSSACFDGAAPTGGGCNSTSTCVYQQEKLLVIANNSKSSLPPLPALTQIMQTHWLLQVPKAVQPHLQ